MEPEHECQIWVCGAEERQRFRSHQLTHLITIANPGRENHPPSWFKGDHLPLWYGDVISEKDASQCHTKAVTSDDVRQAIVFFRAARRQGRVLMLISCDYGASRSPALAYVLLSDLYGAGREVDAFNMMLSIREESVPNPLVVKLGDALMQRKGALMSPLDTYFETVLSNIE